MPETVTPAQLREAADALENLPGVVAATPIKDDARLGRPSLEVTVGPGYRRVPPRVLRVLAAHDLGLHNTAPRGWPRYFTVVAV